MSRTRWILVLLLGAATVLFAVGVIAERSETDTHTEPASVQAQQDKGTEPDGAHEEGQEGAGAEPEQSSGDEHADENEAVLGVDAESKPLIVLAVIAGLGLAALAATSLGRLPGVLGAITLIALAWAALDVREAVHQLDESRAGIAILAIGVAALHLAAAALAGRMASQARYTSTHAPDRPARCRRDRPVRRAVHRRRHRRDRWRLPGLNRHQGPQRRRARRDGA